MTIAILALQGAFAEHAATLDRLGVDHFEIRQPRDLERPFDGLILPGGILISWETFARNLPFALLASISAALFFNFLVFISSYSFRW